MRQFSQPSSRCSCSSLIYKCLAVYPSVWHSARLLESSWTDTALLVELFEKLQEDMHFEPQKTMLRNVYGSGAGLVNHCTAS